jgi:hypothetical protein
MDRSTTAQGMRFWLIILHPEPNGDTIQTATLVQHPGLDILIGSSGQFARRSRMGIFSSTGSGSTPSPPGAGSCTFLVALTDLNRSWLLPSRATPASRPSPTSHLTRAGNIDTPSDADNGDDPASRINRLRPGLI